MFWLRRLRRHRIRYWATSALAALLAMGVVGQLAARAEATRTRFGRLVEVPVAVRDLEAGEEVAASDVRRRALPAALLPLARPAPSWAGHTVVAHVAEGEVVLARRLAPWGVTGAAALVPAGSRAIAVPAGAGGSPPLRIGDNVDLLATVVLHGGDTTDDPPTFALAEAAVVVAIDDRSDTVTVAVPVAVAPRVAFAVATAHVTIVLRGPSAGDR